MKEFIVWGRDIAPSIFKKINLDQQKNYIRDQDPIKALVDSIKIEQVPETRILLLHVEHQNPHLAAKIANRIAEIYVARNLAYITKNEELNLLKNEYLKLESKFSEYSKIYKHKHPKMLRLRQELEQKAARIQQEKANAANPKVAGSVLSGIKGNNITIQDRAEAPKSPVWPKKTLNILLAILIGPFVGAGLAFFFEYLDDTVKGSEDLKHFADWPFLGYVPKMNGFGRWAEIKRDLYAQIKPKDHASEAYRSIRTSVLFSATEEHPLRSLIITSPGPREGKTTVLCNLGITMAQSQRRVLLVDADMRKPRLHKIFAVNNKAGLSSFLCGQVGFGEVVQKTDIDKLFLVTGGPRPPNPSELLTSRKMREFIERAQERFDVIMFDSPPVTLVTDAVVLAQAVDGTIVVLESGRTNKRALPRTQQVLKDARARVIGALLNKIPFSHSSYYYDSYYYKKTK